MNACGDWWAVIAAEGCVVTDQSKYPYWSLSTESTYNTSIFFRTGKERNKRAGHIIFHLYFMSCRCLAVCAWLTGEDIDHEAVLEAEKPESACCFAYCLDKHHIHQQYCQPSFLLQGNFFSKCNGLYAPTHILGDHWFSELTWSNSIIIGQSNLRGALDKPVYRIAPPNFRT